MSVSSDLHLRPAPRSRPMIRRLQTSMAVTAALSISALLITPSHAFASGPLLSHVRSTSSFTSLNGMKIGDVGGWLSDDEEESKKKDAKKVKEAQKKQLRKAKQLFRKLTMAAYQASNPNDSSIGTDDPWDDLEKMNDDIELLCDKLSVMELTSLSDILGGPEAVEEGSNVSINVAALVDVKTCAVETAAGAERQSLLKIQERNQARKVRHFQKAEEQGATRALKDAHHQVDEFFKDGADAALFNAVNASAGAGIHASINNHPFLPNWLAPKKSLRLTLATTSWD